MCPYLIIMKSIQNISTMKLKVRRSLNWDDVAFKEIIKEIEKVVLQSFPSPVKQIVITMPADN